VCDFCRSHTIKEPCVKLRGPKTEAQLTPFGRIPTPIDSFISAEDVLLLHYAYSNVSSFSSIFQRLPAMYGETLPCLPLRHVVLAYAATDLCSRQFEQQRDIHKGKAYDQLIRKINSTTILDSDVIAAFLLLVLAIKEGSRINSEVKAHINGCLCMSKYFLERSGSAPLPDFVVLVISYAFDFMEYCIILDSEYEFGTLNQLAQIRDVRNILYGRRSHNKYRLQYHNEFFTEAKSKSPSDFTEDQRGLFFLLMRTFVILFGLMISCAYCECVPGFKRDIEVANIIQTVLVDLDDPIVLQSFSASTRVPILDKYVSS